MPDLSRVEIECLADTLEKDDRIAHLEAELARVTAELHSVQEEFSELEHERNALNIQRQSVTTRAEKAEAERDKLIKYWPDDNGISGGSEIEIWSGLITEYEAEHPTTGELKMFDDWNAAARFAAGLGEKT